MKVLVLILSTSTILFVGCAKPKVYTNANGESCTYENPYYSSLHRPVGKVTSSLIWGIAGIFGAEQPCRTYSEWTAIYGVANTILDAEDFSNQVDTTQKASRNLTIMKAKLK